MEEKGMKTKAAVVYGPINAEVSFLDARPNVIEELDLDDPKEGECLVKVVASGVCHSDLTNIRTPIGEVPFPTVFGHEAGVIVQKLGKNCRKVKEGDHGIAAWMPACGVCRSCVSGKSYLCDRGALEMGMTLLDGTHRYRKGKQTIGQGFFLGTFSEYCVIPEDAITVIDKDLPLANLGIMGCAIPTGVGAVLNTAKAEPGSTCVVIGCGGIGTSAVQGCRIAGATKIIAIDRNTNKLAQMKKFGATHTINNKEENVLEKIAEITRGVGADYSFECVASDETQTLAIDVIGKGGTAVFVGLHGADRINTMPVMLSMWSKTIMGCLYGSSNMATDIPRFIDMYKDGRLLVDEMITTTYKLEQINEAFDDMEKGKNIRGLIKFD
jgi:NDMA-dependent alcohol dehydrogenase